MVPMFSASPPVVSVRRACALLGLPRAKVTALVNTGILPTTVVGNAHAIAISDIERVRVERPDSSQPPHATIRRTPMR